MNDNIDHPLISIITPSLNQGDFIGDNLDSVMNQDYPRFEHIVIDGGSDDGTIKLLENYQDQYQLSWISEPDQGHAHAVNKGFSQASGEIIGWVNSDDAYLGNGVLSSVAEYFNLHPEIDVIYGDIIFIGEYNNLLMVRCVPRHFGYNRLLRGCFISQPATFFRRTVIEKYQLNQDIKYAVDYEYWLRIAREHKFGHFNKILAVDRYYKDRRMLTGAAPLGQETTLLQLEFGAKELPGMKIINQFDRGVTGSYRRILGLIKMLKIYQQGEGAFPLKLENLGAAIHRQLNPFGGYQKLAGKEFES